MTDSEPHQAYVWTWLPGANDPVVAGVLHDVGGILEFTYGQSYLDRRDAIPLFLPELPLRLGPIAPSVGEVAGCIADSGPDAWGRRVIVNRRLRRRTGTSNDPTLLACLLESGSDRVGALDFQERADTYRARFTDQADIGELLEAAALVEAGVPLTPELDLALLHGSSIGGARPKSLLVRDEQQLIAKFSSTSDYYPVVKGEFLAMELARRVGLDVARVELVSVLDKDVLLVHRFDRPGQNQRSAVVSALTILGLDEIAARYASYADLADTIRARFEAPDRTLRELFARIVFNILSGNNDDHARNHAAFWDGEQLALTPAYDICPQPRSGGQSAQLMAIGHDGFRASQVAGCIKRAPTYHLSEAEATEIVDGQVAVIRQAWDEVCDLARLTEVDRRFFWGSQFLNPYAFEP